MKYTFLLLVSIFFMSCSVDDPKEIDYKAKNDKEILAFIEDNDLVATKTSTGLYYVINKEGTGVQPIYNSNVTVKYTGWFLNGTMFDENNIEAGYSTFLSEVIPGWTEGIPYFKEGGKGLLLIPAHLAYGNFDYKGIPGGSVLLFQINLVSVNN